MTISDLFNALMNAGILTKKNPNGVDIQEGDFVCRVISIKSDNWLVNLPDGTGDIVSSALLISHLQDLLRDKPMSQDRGIEFVVRRLVWYLKDDDAFVMRPYNDIMADTSTSVNIGVYNSVMLMYTQNRVYGTDLMLGRSFHEFKSVKELVDACH